MFFREGDAFLKHRDVSCRRRGRRADLRIFQPGNMRARFSFFAFLLVYLTALREIGSDYHIASPTAIHGASRT